MTIDEMKRDISIMAYLKMQGINPDKTHNGYALYKSPFRDEKTPSFKVDYNKNLWHDFGSGEGGSIIDLVMKMHECNFIQAVEFLEKQKRENLGTYQQTYISKNLNTFSDISLTITAVKPLENPNLLQFL